jgi:hypothetical protein
MPVAPGSPTALPTTAVPSIAPSAAPTASPSANNLVIFTATQVRHHFLHIAFSDLIFISGGNWHLILHLPG